MQYIGVRNYRGNIFSIFMLVIGTGLILVALGAEHIGIGNQSGLGPKQVMLTLAGFAVLFSGVALSSPVRWRYISESLMMLSAALFVAMAAGFLIVFGEPGFATKHLMLALIGFAVLVVRIAPTQAACPLTLSGWIKLLSFDKVEVGKFLSVAVQLLLLVLVIRQFDIENKVFSYNIMRLTLYGFLIHFILPIRYRLPFFVMLSTVTIFGVFDFPAGLWLIGIGLGLIGICHLPIAFNVRVVLLLLSGALLVIFRADWFQAPWPHIIWPILGSIFMFRLIIYVYDLRHQKGPTSFWHTLSYFFLYPNTVFPFFPVVDFSAFRRTYYNDDRYRIYQTGLEWMFRGVIQLILYRFISYNLVMAPSDVTNTAELVQFIIANFALYLQVSGQFHLIIGILHLFGFNLPRTNHLYFLASSFTDLWRRINIYWKDFMLKVFYYPTHFRIRKWGGTSSLVMATTVVFLLTWFFHAYQWFWLRGTFLLAAQDMLFWAVLGLLVIANVVYESKRGRQRTLGRRSWAVGNIMLLAVRTTLTFTVMTILWSLWTSDSIQDWIALISVVEMTPGTVIGLLLFFLAVIVLFGLAIFLFEKLEEKKAERKTGPAPFFKTAAANIGLILLVILLGSPIIYARFGNDLQSVIVDLQSSRLNRRDAELLVQGYYEDLIGIDRFNTDLWEVYMKRPQDWPTIEDTMAGQNIKESLIELVPSISIIFQGKPFSTNRWGMRDQDYNRTPPPNSFRIALLGSSYVMGSGVADGETFESLLEERLNIEREAGQYTKYEILNFAVSGYGPLRNLWVLENKALSFEPDAIFYIASPEDENFALRYLLQRIEAGSDIPYVYLNEIMKKAGISQQTAESAKMRSLKTYSDEIISFAYRRIIENSLKLNLLPVWIYIPTPSLTTAPKAEIDQLAHLADEAGFVVLDLSDVYDHQDLKSLWVAEWDAHPNAQGHKLIAGRLYEELEKNKEKIPIGLTTP